MANVMIEYFGFSGAGRTVTEAKQDAGRKIEALHTGTWEPEIRTWKDHTVLIRRDLTGWLYQFIQLPGEPIRIPQGCAMACDRKDAIESAERHLVQRAWNVGEAINDFPDWFADVNKRKDVISQRLLYIQHAELRAAGYDETTVRDVVLGRIADPRLAEVQR